MAQSGEHFEPVRLSSHAQESTYFLARLIMEIDHSILKLFGLDSEHALFIWIYAALVFLLSWGVGLVCQWLILMIVRYLGKHLKATIYFRLTEAHFFRKVCRIVPAIVFLIFIQFTLYSHASLALWLSRVTYIYLLFVICNALSTLIEVMWHHIDARENKRHLPLNGLVQVIKGIIWIVFGIVSLAMIFDKSPTSLLAGLGAFAAVLMLIFKDSILGLVAGVQLSENDSLHVGDWIKVKGSDANGTVISVSLSSVKILNWDKTVTTVPPYNLISQGFTNFKSMQESNTRRIERSYMIDADSVVECTPAMLEQFKSIPLLKPWIEKKLAQKAAGKVEDVNNSEGLVNGSLDSNLGVFRAYIQLHLNADPNIDKSSTNFVTTLPQTTQGIPLQIYCFTATSQWVPYEAIMAGLFEHIAVMMYRFGLYTNEQCSGRDTLLEGYLCRNKETGPVFGLPFPMFLTPETPTMPSPLDPNGPGIGTTDSWVQNIFRQPDVPTQPETKPQTTAQSQPTPESRKGTSDVGSVPGKTVEGQA